MEQRHWRPDSTKGRSLARAKGALECGEVHAASFFSPLGIRSTFMAHSGGEPAGVGRLASRKGPLRQVVRYRNSLSNSKQEQFRGPFWALPTNSSRSHRHTLPFGMRLREPTQIFKGRHFAKHRKRKSGLDQARVPINRTTGMRP